MDQLNSVGFGSVHGTTGTPVYVFIDINKEGAILVCVFVDINKEGATCMCIY